MNYAFRFVIGLLFMTSLAMPLALYHYLNANIIGSLMGYMVPSGYIAFLIGSFIILYNKIKLNRYIGIKNLFILGGIILIIIYIIQSFYLRSFIQLWHGISGAIDIDYYSMLGYPLFIGIITVLSGIFYPEEEKYKTRIRI